MERDGTAGTSRMRTRLAYGREITVSWPLATHVSDARDPDADRPKLAALYRALQEAWIDVRSPGAAEMLRRVKGRFSDPPSKTAMSRFMQMVAGTLPPGHPTERAFEVAVLVCAPDRSEEFQDLYKLAMAEKRKIRPPAPPSLPGQPEPPPRSRAGEGSAPAGPVSRLLAVSVLAVGASAGPDRLLIEARRVNQLRSALCGHGFKHRFVVQPSSRGLAAAIQAVVASVGAGDRLLLHVIGDVMVHNGVSYVAGADGVRIDAGRLDTWLTALAGSGARDALIVVDSTEPRAEVPWPRHPTPAGNRVSIVGDASGFGPLTDELTLLLGEAPHLDGVPRGWSVDQPLHELSARIIARQASRSDPQPAGQRDAPGRPLGAPSGADAVAIRGPADDAALGEPALGEPALADFVDLLTALPGLSWDRPMVGKVNLRLLRRSVYIAQNRPGWDRILVFLAPRDFEQAGEHAALLADALTRSACRMRGVEPGDEREVQVTVEPDPKIGSGTWRLSNDEGGLSPRPLWVSSSPGPAAAPDPHPDRPQSTDDRRRAIPDVAGYSDLVLIGEGGSSRVFRANQERMGRTVAVKVFADRSTAAMDHGRELRSIVQLSHQPYIATILDTGYTAAGHLYIAMHHYPDGSYEDALLRDGPVSVDEVLLVGIRIGEALDALHRAGIVHRDVKPANILRSEHGPALTDFGISHWYGDPGGPEPATRRLTPQYASPEALRLEPQSAQSDVYSLAATMWALLAGRPPFPAPSDDAELTAWRDRILSDTVPAAPRADLPPGLAEELARAMAKRPVDRHPSARAFAASLVTLRVESAPAAPPPATYSLVDDAAAQRSQRWPVAPRALTPLQAAHDGRPHTIALPKPS